MNEMGKPKITKSQTEPRISKTRKKSSKSKATTTVWTIKGIDNDTRAKVSKVAKNRKETIGKYVDRVLLDAANETLSSGSSHTEISLTNDDMLKQMFEAQTNLSKQVEELVERQNQPLMKRMFGGRKSELSDNPADSG